MKRIYIICTLILVIGIGSGISYFIIREQTAKIPEQTTLITANGEAYDFSQSDKKIKLVEFMYTHCPDICPTTTQKMQLLKNDLENEGVFGEKVQFLSITIDPYRDTPEKMQLYKETFEIEENENWILLTGDQENIKQDQQEIQALANAFQFQYRDPGDGFYVHSTFVYLVDENNQFIKKFPMGKDFNKEDVFDRIMKEI